MSDAERENWTLLVNNGPYGSLSEKHTQKGDRWLRFETGPAIGILPIVMRVSGEIQVLLIEEDKPILGQRRIKIASDYLGKRPNTPQTAREILYQKTGILVLNAEFRLFEAMPGYDPTVAFNISLFLGNGWSRFPDGDRRLLANPVVLNLKDAVDRVLRNEIKDIFSRYVLLLLEAMKNRGELVKIMASL